jgi:DNA uptake protein ComE-like DNA-binding protein
MVREYVFVPIDLNTASDQDILTIPGSGPRLLRELKEYRPYTSKEQFRREMGKYWDAKEVARLERYVVIGR